MSDTELASGAAGYHALVRVCVGWYPGIPPSYALSQRLCAVVDSEWYCAMSGPERSAIAARLAGLCGVRTGDTRLLRCLCGTEMAYGRVSVRRAVLRKGRLPCFVRSWASVCSLCAVLRAVHVIANESGDNTTPSWYTDRHRHRRTDTDTQTHRHRHRHAHRHRHRHKHRQTDRKKDRHTDTMDLLGTRDTDRYRQTLTHRHRHRDRQREREREAKRERRRQEAERGRDRQRGTERDRHRHRHRHRNRQGGREGEGGKEKQDMCRTGIANAARGCARDKGRVSGTEIAYGGTRVCYPEVKQRRVGKRYRHSVWCYGMSGTATAYAALRVTVPHIASQHTAEWVGSSPTAIA
eukprot:3941746-Rhodomonas_salina.2